MKKLGGTWRQSKGVASGIASGRTTYFFIRYVGRGRGVEGGVRAGARVYTRGSVGRLRGETIGRVGVVFLRFALFILRGADVCGILLCLRIRAENNI